MKSWITTVAVVLAWAGASSVSAQSCHGSKAKSEQGTAAVKAEKGGCGSKAKCEGAQACKGEGAQACKGDGKDACQEKTLAAAGVRVMKYKVGEETTCCPKQAEQLAGGDNTKVHFVVGESEYAEKTEALQAYAKVLDEYLETMGTVRYAVGEKCVACPQTAGAMAKASGTPVKYRVATATFMSKDVAEKAAEAARAAAAKITPQTTSDDAKPADAVNAKVELAKARIVAAQLAIDAAAAKAKSEQELAGV